MTAATCCKSPKKVAHGCEIECPCTAQNPLKHPHTLELTLRHAATLTNSRRHEAELPPPSCSHPQAELCCVRTDCHYRLIGQHAERILPGACMLLGSARELSSRPRAKKKCGTRGKKWHTMTSPSKLRQWGTQLTHEHGL